MQNSLILRRAVATDTSHDTHDDFKTKHKQEGQPSGHGAEATIKSDIATNDVFLYMKGVPDAPNCGFSNMACRSVALPCMHAP